jgi:thymidylate synthase (FAD)
LSEEILPKKPRAAEPRDDGPAFEANHPQPVLRPAVKALDEMLGVPLHLLDDGFVRLIDYMGDDSSIVQAARVSYGAGTKRVQDDRALIRYLLRHSHTTPFEMCEIKLHVRVPMDVWRQWIRHRTANINEYSTRYSVAIDAAQKTPPDRWRRQSPENKQGSGGFLAAEEGAPLSESELDLQRTARLVYEARITSGVAREQARKDLPLSTYTEAYWKIDLHNLLHFLSVRMDAHAQEEIRTYATAIGEQIVAKWVPFVWEAFLDYRAKSLQLSRIEFEIVCSLIARSPERARAVAESNGLLKSGKDTKLAPNRERKELESKIRRLGLTPPWE